MRVFELGLEPLNLDLILCEERLLVVIDLDGRFDLFRARGKLERADRLLEIRGARRDAANHRHESAAREAALEDARKLAVAVRDVPALAPLTELHDDLPQRQQGLVDVARFFDARCLARLDCVLRTGEVDDVEDRPANARPSGPRPRLDNQPKYGVRSARLLVVVCRSRVPQRLPRREQGQDLVRVHHRLLLETLDKHPPLPVLAHAQVRVLGLQQVVDNLLVYLEKGHPEDKHLVGVLLNIPKNHLEPAWENPRIVLGPMHRVRLAR